MSNLSITLWWFRRGSRSSRCSCRHPRLLGPMPRKPSRHRRHLHPRGWVSFNISVHYTLLTTLLTLKSFWNGVITHFKTLPLHSFFLITVDLPAMEAITNIVCDYNEDYTSFTLCFFFAENPYFTNEVSTISSITALIYPNHFHKPCSIEYIS